MTILERINDLRRKLMKSLTQHVGKSSNGRGKLTPPKKVKRVLISRPNHRLGNLLLITPLVQEVTNTFPNCKIDLFVKGGLAPTIFQNYINVDKIIQLPKKHFKQLHLYLGGWNSLRARNYDVVINVVKTSSSGRLSVQLSNADNKFFGDIEEVDIEGLSNYNHIAKHSVYSFRNHLNQNGISTDISKEIPTINLKLTEAEIVAGKEIIEELVSKEKMTICFFTFATGSKILSKDWWEQFHERLKQEFPSYNLLEVLPVENVSQLDFKEPSFYSKDIREIGAVLANTAVFIGADSGIMHLANSVQIPTVGLFHSNPQFYSPYGNKSAGFNTSEKRIDELIDLLKSILEAQ